jgi:6,7-dimethyl-8-ribityllumazine synthase
MESKKFYYPFSGSVVSHCLLSFEYISDAVSHGLMRVGLDLQKPVIFGVLTCLTVEQAMARAGMQVEGAKHRHENHGCSWAHAAMRMIQLTRQ